MTSNKIEVLDQGFVELVDVMGSDQSIVDAARVSVSGKGVKLTSDDEALIRYLYRHRHMTPFEMCELKWNIKLPIFVARQMVRHRTASINELSARYSELPEEYWQPTPEELRKQSTVNKQGSSEEPMGAEAVGFAGDMNGISNYAFKTYKRCLDAGMTREQARAVLPVSTYTAWTWKCDLRNVFHFLALRLHPHAQQEIRAYALAMAGQVQERFPIAYKAFQDFHLNTETLTYNERTALAKILHGAIFPNGSIPEFPTKRERDEFIAKLDRLGILVV